MDETKRRRYDSTLEFNDEIPKKFDSETENFYEFFNEYFRMNSYWSKNKKIPDLGDDNTNIKKVQKFYEFWFNFETWREFQHKDEYILEEAENRYERRWMEKENKKLKGKMMKKEIQRIKNLASLAYENDPRIILFNKQIEEEKERKKLLKKQMKEKQIQEQLEKQKQIELQKQKEEEERLRKIQEEKDRIQKIKDEKELFQKQFFENFQKICKEEKFDQFYFQKINESLNENEQKMLNTLLINGKIKSGQQFDDGFQKLIKQKEQKRLKQKELEKQKKLKQQQQLNADWSEQDLKVLYKASLKFPPGTYKRWEQIARKFNDKFTEEQIAFKCNDLKNLKSSNSNVQIEWSQEQQKQLEQALKDIPKNLKPQERWSKIADMVQGKDMKQCVERFKEIQSRLKTKKNQ